MNKVDDLILLAGTTGKHQVFARPEMVKFKDLIIKECVDICNAEGIAHKTRRLDVTDFIEKARLSSMECAVNDIAAEIKETFEYE